MNPAEEPFAMLSGKSKWGTETGHPYQSAKLVHPGSTLRWSTGYPEPRIQTSSAFSAFLVKDQLTWLTLEGDLKKTHLAV